MISLAKKIISRVDRIRVFSRINAKFRAIFVFIMISASLYTVYSGCFYQYAHIIVITLMSTMIINVISDLYSSDVESILKALNYTNAKYRYNESNL